LARDELSGDVQGSELDLRTYLAGELKRLSGHPRFREESRGHFKLMWHAKAAPRRSCFRGRRRSLTSPEPDAKRVARSFGRSEVVAV
jgi:hypothetical protein